MFKIYPAIDLKNGRCVRLKQGRADDETVYSDDPLETARHWVSEGAEYIHVVDLDGAFSGRPAHHDVITKLAASLPVPIEVGGGLRTDADIKALLDCGVARAIIGTRALSSRDDLAGMLRKFGTGLAVGIDARDGRVQVKGWVETTDRLARDLAVEMSELGVRTLIVTDTATDGMLGGTNVSTVNEICAAVECHVIASGGVSSVDDIRRLRALGHDNLKGAIVGKALYDDRVSLAALNKAAEE